MEKWDAVEAPGDQPADPRGSSRGRFAAGTPEDVAALYTWANLQGARYRDFSASRKRYREQVRAQASEPSVIREDGPTESKLILPSLRESSSVSLEDRRKGGSAVRWASNQRNWESSSRSLNREDLVPRIASVEVPDQSVAAALADGFEPWSFDPVWPEQRYEAVPSEHSVHRNVSATERLGRSIGGGGGVESDPLYDSAAELWSDERWERVDARNAEQSSETGARRESGAVQIWEPEVDTEQEIDRPAWLYEAQREASPPPSPHSGVQLRREEIVEPHVRGRWSALREVMEARRVPAWETRVPVDAVKRAPLLVVFSLTGGVGRTSLLSTLGRLLSATGERVVLGDAAPVSLLPFYFGARDLRPGEMRAFAPPEGSEDSPIFLVNYDLQRPLFDAGEQRHMVSEILRDGAECHRILLDLPPSAGWLLRRLATLQPTVLVPLLPDMTSLISLEAVERYFDDMADAEGVPVQPFYLLNQFDESMALHRDIHDLLRKRLRDRLLTIVIRRSGAVSEALAEGMTVADYAPGSPVTRDYLDVAGWLKIVSPAATPGGRVVRSARG